MLYPNPANDFVNISTESNRDSVSVLLSMGQVVSQENVGSTKFQLNTSNLDKGVYFIKIITEKEMLTKQFIVK